MKHILFLVLAYMLLWVVLFGYILSLLKKQKKLFRELQSLASEAAERQ
jgi:CcmD family protein